MCPRSWPPSCGVDQKFGVRPCGLIEIVIFAWMRRSLPSPPSSPVWYRSVFIGMFELVS